MAKIALPTNLDEVESGFEVIPDADYLVRITKYKIRDGKEAPNIFWTSKIFGNDNAELNGKPVGFNTSLAEQSLWFLKGLLENTGVKWDAKGFDPDHVVGKEVGCKVSIGEYQNKPRNQVDSFFPAT
ncbi:MAG: hypothetical protein ACXABY_13845 [Candidatus Thorarchaeota archaeon]|jgi:hypothetical protein